MHTCPNVLLLTQFLNQLLTVVELKEWIKKHGIAVSGGVKPKAGKSYSQSYWTSIYWCKTELVRIISSAIESDSIKAGVEQILEKVFKNSCRRTLLNHTCFVSESVLVPGV